MKQVEYRKNIPPAQNVNVKWDSDLQFRPHLIPTKARIPFFVFFFLFLVFWTAILDFCGGFRWQLVPRLPFPVPLFPLPVPRFSIILVLLTIKKPLTKSGMTDFNVNYYKLVWDWCFYKLIKKLYSNSSGALKVGMSQTRCLAQATTVDSR